MVWYKYSIWHAYSISDVFVRVTWQILVKNVTEPGSGDVNSEPVCQCLVKEDDITVLRTVGIGEFGVVQHATWMRDTAQQVSLFVSLSLSVCLSVSLCLAMCLSTLPVHVGWQFFWYGQSCLGIVSQHWWHLCPVWGQGTLPFSPFPHVHLLRHLLFFYFFLSVIGFTYFLVWCDVKLYLINQSWWHLCGFRCFYVGDDEN